MHDSSSSSERGEQCNPAIGARHDFLRKNIHPKSGLPSSQIGPDVQTNVLFHAPTPHFIILYSTKVDPLLIRHRRTPGQKRCSIWAYWIAELPTAALNDVTDLLSDHGRQNR